MKSQSSDRAEAAAQCSKSATAPQIRRPESAQSAEHGQRQRRASVGRAAAATRRGFRLLDAAERSFAEGGFDGVSLRIITEVAGVDLALANYHFGTKENLLREVIARRARIVHDERCEALELARQQRHAVAVGRGDCDGVS